MKMNFYVFLLMYSFWVVSIFASAFNRVESAKLRWQQFRLKGRKSKNPGPNDEKKRVPRHHGREVYRRGDPPKPIAIETTTTKSPEDVIREEWAKQRKRNPKRIPSLQERPLQKRMKDFSERLRRLSQKKCTTNHDCSNVTCCMVDISDGYCKKPPHHLNQRCSDFCPCSGNMECKIKEFRNSGGPPSYIKQCLKISEPESVNINLVKKLAFAKRQGSKVRVPRDSKDKRGTTSLAL